MKAIKVEYGGGYNGVHNLQEIKDFMMGEDFGYIVNGGGGRKKPSMWATLSKILVMSDEEPVVVKHGDYLVKLDNGNYISLTEGEFNEL